MIEQEKDCPFCVSKIPVAAKKCKFCRETVDVAMRASEEAIRLAAGSGQMQQRPILVNAKVDSPMLNRGPNHILHFLLTIFTAGFWLPIWILVIIFSKPKQGA